AVLVTLVLAEHRVEPLVQILVGAAPGVVDAHRVVRGDRPVEEAPLRAARVLGAQALEGPSRAPLRQDLVLLGDEVGLRVDRLEHRASVGRSGDRTGTSILPAMQRAQESRPRAKSAFVAAFLSLLFPGLGHAYAGAYQRALGFAAPPILVGALLAGVFLRMDGAHLIAFLLTPWVVPGIFVLNLFLLVYRLVAIIDAYRVTVWLNALAANAGGRLGRPRLVFHPVSLAGLLAVVLVMSGAHVVVARYDLLAWGA